LLFRRHFWDTVGKFRRGSQQIKKRDFTGSSCVELFHQRSRRTVQTLDLKVIEGMKRRTNANENTALKTSLALCFAEVLAPFAAPAGEAATK
jgi:hypothetical protein